MDKSKMRARLAALSFTDKIRILEKLRDRDLMIAASGLRRKAAEVSSKHANKRTANQGDLDTEF